MTTNEVVIKDFGHRGLASAIIHNSITITLNRPQYHNVGNIYTHMYRGGSEQWTFDIFIVILGSFAKVNVIIGIAGWG